LVIAAILVGLITSSQTALAEPTVAASDREEFAGRAGEMLRRVAVNKAPTTVRATKGSNAAQGLAIAKLKQEAGDDIEIHLRPGEQTVMQLRGRALAAPKGTAVPALADSHEHTAREFFGKHRGLMGLKQPDQEFVLRKTEGDELGHQHLRFSQFFKGLPVWPSELSAHFDQTGTLMSVDGAYAPTPELDSVSPALSADEAEARAKTALAPGKKSTAGKTELVVYRPLRERARLGWKLELTASLLESWLVIVDAQDGSILHRSPLVCDAQVQGSGADLFGATRPLHIWQQGTTYYMVDTSKASYNAGFDPINNPHGVIDIGDAKGVGVDQVLQIGSADLVTSATPNAWNVPGAVSAAYNFSEVYDYFLERHQRNSIDGQGGNITAFVNVGNYDNACWIGSLGIMLFGNTQPYPASLDAVGHELTHGVTDHSAGLIHQKQSGALSEALSDIFGEMVEARTRGHNDWVIGTELTPPLRNLKDPGAIPYFDRRYPAKMSEYINDPDTENGDWGGVHANATIIGHAFYLLAEGLPDAIGQRSAASIVYRCQTLHLFAQSEFVDFRLGCVASAEELFGKDSTEVRVTAEAFDAVEIYATPGTPEPTPIPVVTGPDSTLFVYYDIAAKQYNLARREAAQGDQPEGTILAYNVSLVRPAVSGDGTTAFFVSADSDLCAVETTNFNSRQCLGMPGIVHSVAYSPDGHYAAFVLRDKVTGQPEAKITLLDLAANQAHIYNLVAPTAEGVHVDTVLYADSMTFSTDSTTLIYDALSQLKFGSGPLVAAWSIYSLHLDSGQTTILVPPADGIDSGNPAVGRAGNRYLVYDALNQATGTSGVTVLDLFTGQASPVASAPGGFANPVFLGDESGVTYSVSDPTAVANSRSIYKQNITADHLHGNGDATLWYHDANLGVIYRRGTFQSSNALPTVTLASSADQIPAQGSVTLTATASDSDGTISRVEFYDGSTRLAVGETAPYIFTWNNASPGNHLLIARAVDNLGGSKDSSPRFLTVTGGGTGGNKPPVVSLQLSSDTITLPASVTLTATATDPDGTIDRVIFYDSSSVIGEVKSAPYVFVWQPPSPGNHLLAAHGIDNLGAETTSSPRFLTVIGNGGGGSSGDKPKISIKGIGKGTVRLTISAQPGNYIIQLSEDLQMWVDIYPVTVDATGTGSIDDSTPLTNSRLFFRARPDQ
jgi:Zn-dependent metalloprotease